MPLDSPRPCLSASTTYSLASIWSRTGKGSSDTLGRHPGRRRIRRRVFGRAIPPSTATDARPAEHLQPDEDLSFIYGLTPPRARKYRGSRGDNPSVSRRVVDHKDKGAEAALLRGRSSRYEGCGCHSCWVYAREDSRFGNSWAGVAGVAGASLQVWRSWCVGGN